VKSYFLPCGVPENPVFEDQSCNRPSASICPDLRLFRPNLSQPRQKGRCFLPRSKKHDVKMFAMSDQKMQCGLALQWSASC
jgi:hypothetical protein